MVHDDNDDLHIRIYDTCIGLYIGEIIIIIKHLDVIWLLVGS